MLELATYQGTKTVVERLSWTGPAGRARQEPSFTRQSARPPGKLPSQVSLPIKGSPQRRAVKGPHQGGETAESWRMGRRKWGRRSSTAMCLPHSNPGLNNTFRGNLLPHFVQTLEPYHQPVSHSGQCRGQKVSPNKLLRCIHVTPTSSVQFNARAWRADLSIPLNLLSPHHAWHPSMLSTSPPYVQFYARDDHKPC